MAAVLSLLQMLVWSYKITYQLSWHGAGNLGKIQESAECFSSYCSALLLLHSNLLHIFFKQVHFKDGIIAQGRMEKSRALVKYNLTVTINQIIKSPVIWKKSMYQVFQIKYIWIFIYSTLLAFMQFLSYNVKIVLDKA